MSERTEWLERRRLGIGGSDIAAILGCSPFESPWSIWAQKVGLVPVDDSDAQTETMEAGQRIEPVLRQWFEDRTGLYVGNVQEECVHPDYPFMRCTLDGRTYDAPVDSDDLLTLGIFEAKRTSHAVADWEPIPVHIMAQLQWNMAVTGAERAWLATWHEPFGRVSFVVREVARDEADITVMTKAAIEFWDHCLTGEPPPTDGSQVTTDALSAAWDPIEGETEEADDDVVTAVSMLHALKAERKDLDATIAAFENDIRAALGPATALVNGRDDKGKPIVLATWKAQDRTTVDVHALAADHPDIAEQYSKTTTSRVLRLTKNKGE